MEHENIHLSAFARAVIIAAASWLGLQRCRSNLVCLVRNHRYIWLNLILLAPSPSVQWVGDQSNLPGVIEVGTLGWLIANSRMWRKRKWVYFVLLIRPSIMLGTRWHDQPVRILEAGWSQTEAGKSKKIVFTWIDCTKARETDGWMVSRKWVFHERKLCHHVIPQRDADRTVAPLQKETRDTRAVGKH